MPCDDDGTVERGTRSLSLIRNHSTRRSLIDFTVGLSLHQNQGIHIATRGRKPSCSSRRTLARAISSAFSGFQVRDLAVR